MIDIGLGPWWWMSVCLQILPPSCIKSISFPLTPAQVLSNGLLNKGCAAVSPAYVYVLLALVKHSNEGGPGPRYNMKEDPGSSTLIMKREHGHGVPCNPGQVIRIWGAPAPLSLSLSPSSEQPGQSPLPPPSSTYSSPCKGASRDQPSYFFIIFWIILNMFQMLFLIMYSIKLLGFDRLFNLTMMTRTQ